MPDPSGAPLEPAPHEPAPITVLLATHQGRKYLPEQLDSILAQQDVAVRVLVSDDGSTDGTWEYLLERAAGDDRVVLLPRREPTGGAAANFYRLLRDVPDSGGYVALSDQDDIWAPDKLASQVAVLESGADGVSSDVTAFHPDGTRQLIRKSYPQREFDYLLESPGPGSTFLLSPRLVRRIQSVLEDSGAAAAMQYHDWLIYGICRASGWRWHIQDVSTVSYRQHETNVMGANRGISAIRERLALMRSHWHRGEAVKMAAVAAGVAPTGIAARLARVQPLLSATGPGARIRLAAEAGRLRRRPRDRMIIGGLVLLGLW